MTIEVDVALVVVELDERVSSDVATLLVVALIEIIVK
jgi:hypothetical protein